MLSKNSKAIFNIIVGLFLFGIASCSFAADMNLNFFKPPATDQSLQLLKLFFGDWNGPFAEKNIIAVMFKYFNIAMLTLGTIIIIYNVIVSIINTAHQGKFLGKKFDTVWGPIRIVLGFVLIIPTGSGYSIIQIFIMWMVSMGIGAADNLWSKSIDFVFKRGSPVINYDARISEQDLINKNADILQRLYCMHSRKESIPQRRPVCDDKTYTCSVTWSFGDSGECGDLKLTISPASFSMPAPTSRTDPSYIKIANAFNATFVMWENNIAALNTFAGKLTNDYENVKKDFVERGNNELANVTRETAHKFTPILQNFKTALPSLGMNEYWEQQKRLGWITAGIAQFKIARTAYQSALQSNFSDIFAVGTMSWKDGNGEIKNFIGNTLTKDAQQMSDPTFVAPAEINRPNLSDTTALLNNVIQQVVGIIIVKLRTVVNYFTSLDPLINLQMLGEFLLTLSSAIYAAAAVITTAASLVGTTVLGTGSVPAGITILTYITVPTLIVTGALYVEGIMLAIVLPLTPFILFMSAAIFWFVGVLETMLAGPLTALMFLFLEDSGQDLLRGRAGPGINMIINMFLRPMLILFGLFAAMKITGILVDLILKFYAIASIYILFPGEHMNATAVSIVTFMKLVMLGLTSFIGLPVVIFIIKIIILLGILIALVTLIINKVYTLCIIKLPNAVVSKFFQGGETLGGEEGLMGELTQKAQQMAGTAKETSGALAKGVRFPKAESEAKAVGVTNTGGESTSAPSSSGPLVVAEENKQKTVPNLPSEKQTAGKQGNKFNEI